MAIAVSLFAMLLECSSTCVVRFMLTSVRLVTDDLYSAVAYTRLAKAYSIHTRLLDP